MEKTIKSLNYSSNPLSPPRMMLSTTSLKKQIPSSRNVIQLRFPIMKYLTATSAVIFSLLFLPSCKDGKEAAGTNTKNEENGNPSLESKAVDAFKDQVKSLELNETMQAFEAVEAIAEEGPSPMFESIFSLNDKLQELKTDDLPEDLKAATRTLQNIIGSMSGHFKKLPIPMDVITKGEEVITAWVGEKMAADPSFMESFGSSMKGWEKEMDKLGKAMEDQGDEVVEVYKKYEIPIDFPWDKEEEGQD